MVTLDSTREAFDKWRETKTAHNIRTPDYLKDMIRSLLENHTKSEICSAVNVRPHIFNRLEDGSRKKPGPKPKKSNFIKASISSPGLSVSRAIASVKLSNQVSIDILSGIEKSDLKSILQVAGGFENDRNF